MERKIGEKFTIDGKTYITVKGEECAGCAFEYSSTCLSTPLKTRHMGTCSRYEREDSTSVIFKEVHSSDFDIDNKSIKPNKMKPFNLEEAKAGKPVCTRDGRKARIVCFDIKGCDNRILALIENKTDEIPCRFFDNGRFYSEPNNFCNKDLMMVTEKKQGWMNIYKSDFTSPTECAYTSCIYNTKEDALAHVIRPSITYVGTFPFEWEE